ncbi:MAG: hypothetical protein ABI374_08145 [Ginsengibacter sp.]
MANVQTANVAVGTAGQTAVVMTTTFYFGKEGTKDFLSVNMFHLYENQEVYQRFYELRNYFKKSS